LQKKYNRQKKYRFSKKEKNYIHPKTYFLCNDFPMDPAYTHLAKYYDSLMPESWYSSWARFARLHIKRAGIKPRLIIDLACGTGRLAARLNRIAPVIGIDNSLAMLRVARHNYPNVHFHAGALTTFKLPGRQKTDIITCAFDSLNYLPSDKELHVTLARCISRLSPRGLLLFDVNGERAFSAQGKKTNRRAYVFGNDQIIWKNTFYPKVWKAEFEIRTKNAHGRQIKHYEQHIEKYYSPQLILEILKRLDVRVLGIYRDAVMHRVTKKNKRYFFVVQKNQ